MYMIATYVPDCQICTARVHNSFSWICFFDGTNVSFDGTNYLWHQFVHWNNRKVVIWQTNFILHIAYWQQASWEWDVTFLDQEDQHFDDCCTVEFAEWLYSLLFWAQNGLTGATVKCHFFSLFQHFLLSNEDRHRIVSISTWKFFFLRNSLLENRHSQKQTKKK